MAYDPVSGKIVMHGGYGTEYLNETWVYDVGANVWTEAKPWPAPSPRGGHAMVHIGQGKLLMFGGEFQPASGETWIYEVQANAWTKLNPASPPPGRAYHGMSYDQKYNKVVVFGGAESGPANDETWTFDPAGVAWKKETLSLSPAPRRNPTMVWDPTSGYTTLFGGGTVAGNYGDTWLFSPGVGKWQNASPVASPPARHIGAMAYSPQAGGPLLFGGEGVNRLADTWAFNYSTNTWKEDKTPSAPTPRMGHAMAHDPVSGTTVLFGGDDGNRVGDTWVYGNAPPPGTDPKVMVTRPGNGAARVDPAAKVEVEFNVDMDAGATAGAFSISPPVAGGSATVASRLLAWTHSAPFTAPAMYTVTISTAAKSAGGKPLPAPYTFSFNVSVTKGKWTDAKPTASPPPRRDLGLACDPQSGRAVMFGGEDGTGSGYLGDTWYYEAAGNTWTQVSASGPSARRSPAMQALGNGKVLLFGGEGSGGVLGDSWMFDASSLTWTPVSGTLPPARSHSPLALDNGRNQVIMFGGYDGGAAVSDTWSYSIASGQWTKLSTATSPEPRYAHAMAHHPASDAVVLMGGQVALNPNGDTWHYFPATNAWEKKAPLPSPAKRSRHALVADVPSGELVAYGGDDRIEGLLAAAAIFSDTWHYRPGSSSWVDESPAFNPGPNTDHGMCYDSKSGSTVLFGGEGSNGVKGETWLYSTGPPPPPPPQAPHVVSTTPANAQTGVALDAAVEVVFDLDMDPAATSSSFSISPAVAGSAPTVSGKMLSWTHSSPYAEKTIYTVTVSTAAKSAAGAALPQPHTFAFETATVPSGQAPKVSGTQPPDGSTGVGLKDPVFVIFDREMDPASTKAAFSVDPQVSGEANVSGSVLKFTPAGEMSTLTKHTVKIGAGARASNGAALGAEFQFSFTTKDKPQPPPPPDNKTGPPEGGTILGVDSTTFLLVAGGAIAVIVAAAAALLVRRRRKRADVAPPEFFGQTR
jgi:hypothetical protein